MTVILKKLLNERLGYTPKEIETLLPALSQLSEDLQPVLHKWIENNHVSDKTLYHGYSLDKLCNEGKMNFIAALLTLDWIIKEPQKAVSVIRAGIK